MPVTTALKTAIEYEKKIRDYYLEAGSRSKVAEGRQFFDLLAKEENSHVAYLENKLIAWMEHRKLGIADLDRTHSHADFRAKPANRVGEMLADDVRQEELSLLEKAREVEVETSQFYEKMVATLPDEGKAFFNRFLQIEQDHLNAVQYQIDSLTGTGFWMGIAEFDMEAID